MVIFIAITNIY